MDRVFLYAKRWVGGGKLKNWGGGGSRPTTKQNATDTMLVL